METNYPRILRNPVLAFGLPRENLVGDHVLPEVGGFLNFLNPCLVAAGVILRPATAVPHTPHMVHCSGFPCHQAGVEIPLEVEITKHRELTAIVGNVGQIASYNGVEVEV